MNHHSDFGARLLSANDHAGLARDWSTARAASGTMTPLRQLVVTLWRRKLFILALTLIGGILAGLAGLSRPALYEASAQLIIDAPGVNAQAGNAGGSIDLITQAVDDHMATLISQGQVRRALDSLIAHGDVQAIAALRKEGTSSGLMTAISIALHSWTEQVRLLLRGSAPVAKKPALDPNAAPLIALQNGLRVGQELRSRVISVGFTNKDPELAAHMVNRIMQAYIDYLTGRNQSFSSRSLSAIDSQIPLMQSELAAAIEARQLYSLTNGGGDQVGADATAREIAQLRQLLTEAEANLSDARLRAAVSKTPQKAGAGQETQDFGIQVFRAQIQMLEERRALLEKTATDAVKRASGLRALELRVENASTRYNEALARRESLKQAIKAPAPSISILSTAWTPTNSKTLSAIFLIPPGMILAALLGAIIAVLSNAFDKTLRSDSQVAEALGIPSAGLLPKFRRPTARTLRNIVLGGQPSPYARAASSILVAFASSTETRQRRCVLVTSSTQRESKTALAWTLALSASQLGHRVLFIDADTAQDPLTRSFRAEFGVRIASEDDGTGGAGRKFLNETVESMPEAGIDFLPSNARTTSIFAMLSARNIEQSFEEIRKQYGFVVVNAPAVIERPEVRMLCTLVDDVLFAMRWGSTPRHVAAEALAILRQDGDYRDLVRGVLTDVDLRKQKKYGFRDSGELLRMRP